MTETMPLLSPAGACVVAKYYAAQLERLRPLLSPVGARVVTATSVCNLTSTTSYCPQKGFIYCHYSTRLTPNQLILRILCRTAAKP